MNKTNLPTYEEAKAFSLRGDDKSRANDGSGHGWGWGKCDGSGDGGGGGGDCDGSGDGSGGGGRSGGDCDGSGDGSGWGSGHGYGHGDGSGHGGGSGHGIKSLNGVPCVVIDGILTAITGIKGNVAKGFTVQDDLSLVKCFVVKDGGKFAHGSTLLGARTDLARKLLLERTVDQRIDEFKKAFPSKTKKYAARLFFDWHGTLTGSCKYGREAFAKSHGIDLHKRKMTVNEFIDISADEYGGGIIKLLREK